MRNIIISPSLLSADFSRIGSQLQSVQDAGATNLHLDVMDGFFVPNISFGIPVIHSLRKSSSMHFDAHLMIEKPERYIEQFAKAGSDSITIHVEATEDPASVLRDIRSLGLMPAISVKPKTDIAAILPYLDLCDRVLVMTVEPGFGGQSFMADMLPKVSELVSIRKKHGLHFEIQVDGGVNMKTAALCVKAGADNLVAGSSVFGAENPGEAYRLLLLSALEGNHEHK